MFLHLSVIHSVHSVWLPGPMFLPGVSVSSPMFLSGGLSLWSHFPLGVLVSGPMFLWGVSVSSPMFLSGGLSLWSHFPFGVLVSGPMFLWGVSVSSPMFLPGGLSVVPCALGVFVYGAMFLSGGLCFWYHVPSGGEGGPLVSLDRDPSWVEIPMYGKDQTVRILLEYILVR